MKVGDKATIKKSFSEEDVETFSSLSGDTNPIHLDDQYASASIFGRRVVHGILTTSLVSAILGTKLPGPGAIYLGQEVKFLKPVFINEEVTAEVEVVELKEEKSIAIMKTICYTEAGTVVEGKAVLKYK